MSARGLGLREMMRRASTAARAVSGLDVRDSLRDSGSGGSGSGAGASDAADMHSIPTLNWLPDAPPTFDTGLSQRKYLQD